MIKNINVEDNVFQHPLKISELAKKQIYFSFNEHPLYPNVYYEGYRTKNLAEILNKDTFIKIHQELFSKLILNKEYDCNYSFDFVVDSFFHYTTKKNVYNEDWIHQDDSNNFLAGIVYLSESPDSNLGTKILLKEKEIVVENIFNRGVIYNSKLFHSALGGFGNGLEDGRFTLTFFIKKMWLEIQSSNYNGMPR